MREQRTAGASDRRTFGDVLGEAGLERLRQRASRRSFAAGEILCREGDRLHRVFLLERGLVAVTKLAPSGRQVLLELRGGGELVGELSAVDGEARSASVHAVEAGALVAFDAAELLHLVRTDGDVAMALLVTLTAKVRESSSRHLELGTTESMARVARRLVELWQLRGGAAEFASPLSQQELADWAGVSRDAVVRALTQFRRAGVVETGRRRFVVRDAGRLRALADGDGA
jgi:CRP-like cAMP-binding protein